MKYAGQHAAEVENRVGWKDERYFISLMSSTRGTAPSGMIVRISSSRRSLMAGLRARQYDLHRKKGVCGSHESTDLPEDQ